MWSARDLTAADVDVFPGRKCHQVSVLKDVWCLQRSVGVWGVKCHTIVVLICVETQKVEGTIVFLTKICLYKWVLSSFEDENN